MINDNEEIFRKKHRLAAILCYVLLVTTVSLYKPLFLTLTYVTKQNDFNVEECCNFSWFYSRYTSLILGTAFGYILSHAIGYRASIGAGIALSTINYIISLVIQFLIYFKILTHPHNYLGLANQIIFSVSPILTRFFLAVSVSSSVGCYISRIDSRSEAKSFAYIVPLITTAAYSVSLIADYIVAYYLPTSVFITSLTLHLAFYAIITALMIAITYVNITSSNEQGGIFEDYFHTIEFALKPTLENFQHKKLPKNFDPINYEHSHIRGAKRYTVLITTLLATSIGCSFLALPHDALHFKDAILEKLNIPTKLSLTIYLILLAIFFVITLAKFQFTGLSEKFSLIIGMLFSIVGFLFVLTTYIKKEDMTFLFLVGVSLQFLASLYITAPALITASICNPPRAYRHSVLALGFSLILAIGWALALTYAETKYKLLMHLVLSALSFFTLFLGFNTYEEEKTDRLTNGDSNLTEKAMAQCEDRTDVTSQPV